MKTRRHWHQNPMWHTQALSQKRWAMWPCVRREKTILVVLRRHRNVVLLTHFHSLPKQALSRLHHHSQRSLRVKPPHSVLHLCVRCGCTTRLCVDQPSAWSSWHPMSAPAVTTVPVLVIVISFIAPRWTLNVFTQASLSGFHCLTVPSCDDDKTHCFPPSLKTASFDTQSAWPRSSPRIRCILVSMTLMTPSRPPV